MKTLVVHAKDRKMTRPMKEVANVEHIKARVLTEGIAQGSIAIMRKGKRSVGIGKGLATKVNVNIGTSSQKLTLRRK